MANDSMETGAAVEERTSFDIPDYNMPTVEAKIAKLNKRAAKLGAEPIKIIIVKKWDRRIIVGDGDDVQFAGARDDFTTTTLQPVKVIPTTTIQIDGKAPKLNGWELVSVVEPVEGGNLMRKFPGTKLEVPIEFRDVSPDRCDHCHTVRKRNETFVVHNAEQSKWMVVGRSCLADFTGIRNPEAIANYASTLADLMLSVADEERVGGGGFGGGGYYQAPIRSFLYTVAIWAGRHGFVTSTQAKKHNEAIDWSNNVDARELHPTGREVFDLFFKSDNCSMNGKEKAKFVESITDEEDFRASELVDAAMEWGKTEFVEAEDGKLSDYGHNMKLLLGANYVRSIDAGFVSSVIPGYKRSLEPKRKKIDGKNHVGAIGEKITVPVTVERVHDWEGQYGLVHITTMLDDEGNILTWFAPAKFEAMKVGEYKVMTAKVKRHDDRNGVKSTVVTYPKFS